MVAYELADIRRREVAVVPFCPYVRRGIADDPDSYLDLVPAQDEDRFRRSVAPGVKPRGQRQKSAGGPSMGVQVIVAPGLHGFEAVLGGEVVGFHPEHTDLDCRRPSSKVIN